MNRPRRPPAPLPASAAHAVLLGVLVGVFVPPVLLSLLLPMAGPARFLTWTGVALLALALALTATWWVTRRLDISVRDLGLAPTWTRHPGLLARMDYQYQGLVVFGVCLSLFLVPYTVTFLPGMLATDTSTDHAHLDALLLGPAQIAVAIATEVVFLGLVVTLAEAGGFPVWEVYLISTLARTALSSATGWDFFLWVPIGLAAVWAYRRTRRLTPVIAAHATAALTQTMVAAWASWISGTVYPPTTRLLLPLL